MREQWELCWQDYYETLQVHPKAGQAVIGKAYRTLAQQHHSDVGGSGEEMVRINLAYEVLSDLARRSRYDVAYGGRQSGERDAKPQSRKREPVEVLTHCLREAGLKYRVSGNSVVLPFSSSAVDDLTVYVRALEELVVIAAPLANVGRRDRAALHNLLRATHRLDTYKLCCGPDERFLVSAEIPYSLVTAQTLGGFVRGCAALADAKAKTYRSSELDTVVTRVRARTAIADLSQLVAGERRGVSAKEELLAYCRGHSIACRRLDESVFSFDLPGSGVHVNALCHQSSASFIVSTGVTVKRSHSRFYTDLAKLNMKMDICKVALDRDDEVTFLYEVPHLEEQVISEAVERIKRYLVTSGLRIIISAAESNKKKGVLGLLGRS